MWLRFSYSILIIPIIALSSNAAEQSVPPQEANSSSSVSTTASSLGSRDDGKLTLSIVSPIDPEKINLEPRGSDRSFVKDIVDRLHALDADIGKLLYNSTSMYAPNDQNIAYQDGGEKFTEVLTDLDSLQDHIGGMMTNATRARQYNMLVRLRPLNNILYRIRHNLHLMRNSLVAINTVSSLEKIGNSVLDSTLQAFMRPDADLNEEIGDTGNYDINLDKFGDVPRTTVTTTTSTTTTTTPPPPPSSTTTTTTTTTRAPSTSAAPIVAITRALSSTNTSTENPSAALSSTEKPSTTKRPTQRPPTRRANQRQNARRTTQKPTNTTTTYPTTSRSNRTEVVTQ